MRLSGRNAIVTGGSRGIGKGIAIELAKEGADVAVLYVSQEAQASDTVAQIKALGRKALAVRCDVGDYDQVQRAVQQAVEALGTVDVFVHNAGLQGPLYPVAETTLEDMKRVMDVDFWGAFYFTKELLPHMQKNPRGDIIYISTIGTKHRGGTALPYGVAKKALETMALSYAAGLHPLGIRVNVLAPGVVDTDMSKESLRQSTRVTLDVLPYKRFLLAEEVGRAAVFLCSEDGSYISGQIIYLDGGSEWP